MILKKKNPNLLLVFKILLSRYYYTHLNFVAFCYGLKNVISNMSNESDVQEANRHGHFNAI